MMQKRPTISQPQVIATGPPWLNAIAYEVRQPARIEMIVNEIAKFWNPPMERKSSCAYPRLCRCFVSSSTPALCGSSTAGPVVIHPPCAWTPDDVCTTRNEGESRHEALTLAAAA